MSKDKRAGVFIPGATGEGEYSEETAWTFVLEQLNAIHEAVKMGTTQRDRDIRGLVGAGQAMAIPMLRAAKAGRHKNPGALVVYGNPAKDVLVRAGTWLGRVEQLKYHRTIAPTGAYYHDFDSDPNLIAGTVVDTGKRVLLIVNASGKPLWGEA